MAYANDVEFTDEVLWISFKNGDRNAFEVLLKRYYAVLFRYSSRFTKNRAMVEDCIQDVFIYIWEHRMSLSTPPSVKFYLLKSVRNRMFLDLKEANRVVEHNPDTSFEEDIEKHLIREEIQVLNKTRLSSLLNLLPARQREALFLKYFEGLSVDEIGEIMGVNRQSAANFLYRALTTLRENWVEKAFTLLFCNAMMG
ncbi:MAG: sigma-70 family RNA polymerase sigma factor [Spirosomataceae bacterium]